MGVNKGAWECICHLFESNFRIDVQVQTLFMQLCRDEV